MRRPTSILDLPQELLDLVIDHFYDDLATLRDCALVARAWLQPAQTHLFRDIRLRHPTDIFTFRNLIIDRGYIARSVRILRVNAKMFKPRYYGNRPVESPYIETIQDRIFTSLGQLRTLHFEDVHFDIFPLDRGLLDAIGMLPIHELRFSKCDFRNFETFERFVFANPRCTHLSLDDIKWKEAPDPTTFSKSLSANRAALGLTHISLGSYCEIDLYSNWLAQTSVLSTLRSLEMTGLTDIHDVKLGGDLLKRVAGTLQHLRLKCSFSCAYEPQLLRIPHVINLTPLQKLYSLHLSPQGQANHQFSWASALLAQTTSPLLRKVTIDAYLVTNRQELKLTEWERFVGLLETPRFSHVDQIRIWYRGPMALDEAEALVKEDLAGLPERRKVRVEDHVFRG